VLSCIKTDLETLPAAVSSFSHIRHLDLAGAKQILKSGVPSELLPGSVKLSNPTDEGLQGMLGNSLSSPARSRALWSHSSPLL